MSTTSESKEWRKFLQPLVTGLVAFLAAATLYVQRSTLKQINKGELPYALQQTNS